MINPDIIADSRVGLGYISVVLMDPTDLEIVNRKWDFGDGVIVEGVGLSTVYHTYYTPGRYNLKLIASTSTNDYTVEKNEYIIVDEYVSPAEFIIAQSFDSVSGDYWRFYVDSGYYLVFEDKSFIYKSKYSIIKTATWQFVDFHRITKRMYVGSYYEPLKEIPIVKIINNNPIISIMESKTEVQKNCSMKEDELRIWSTDVSTREFYNIGRTKAGILDRQV